MEPFPAAFGQYTLDKQGKHTKTFTLRFTPQVGLEPPPQHTKSISLDCGRKPEYLEGTPTHTQEGLPAAPAGL